MEKRKFTAIHVSQLPLVLIHSLIKSSTDLALPLKSQLSPIVVAALDKTIDINTKLGVQSNINQKSLLTTPINVLETEIKDLFAEIKRAVSYNLKESDAVKKAAAVILEHYMATSWELLNLPQDTRTDAINLMLQEDLMNREAKTVIATLGLEQKFATLGTKNTDFDTLYKNRLKEHSGHESSGSTLKPEVIGSYQDLCTSVEQVVNLTPDENTVTLFNQMDELRKTYHALIPGDKNNGKTDPPADK